jgi:hypothetical protein
MKMVRNERPGIALCFALPHQSVEALQKIFSVRIVFKDFAPLNPSGDDMMERSRGIYSGSSRHGVFLT